MRDHLITGSEWGSIGGMSQSSDAAVTLTSKITIQFQGEGEGTVVITRSDETVPRDKRRFTIFKPRKGKRQENAVHWAKLFGIVPQEESIPGPDPLIDLPMLVLLGMAKGESSEEAWCDLRELATFEEWPKKAGKIGEKASRWLARNPSGGLTRYAQGDQVAKTAAQATFVSQVRVVFRPALGEDKSLVDRTKAWIAINQRARNLGSVITAGDPPTHTQPARRMNGSIVRSLFESYRIYAVAEEERRLLLLQVLSLQSEIFIDGDEVSQDKMDELTELNTRLDGLQAECELLMRLWLAKGRGRVVGT